MRAALACLLFVALAASSATAADPEQECRDAYAERQRCRGELESAYRQRDAAGIRSVEERMDAADRRFRAAFASVPFDAWDDASDGNILDDGLRGLGDDSRARGDLATARRALAALVARSRSHSAFKARGLSLPELDLATGDVDAALRGFRAGALESGPRWHDWNAERALTARLRIGDVLAACGDLDGARAEFAAAQKALESADTRNPVAADLRRAGLVQVEPRRLVGTPMPALPECDWIGGPPVAKASGVTIVFAGRIGLPGDAGRLRELDRLHGEASARGVIVRIVVAIDRVGEPVRGREGPVVHVPRGPADSEGEDVAFDGKDVSGLVAKLRERLGLRVPIGIARAPLAEPFGERALMLVADRAGKIVHASVAGAYTDWVCGLARVAASGVKPSDPPAVPSGVGEQEQRDACARNLRTLAGRFARELAPYRTETVLPSPKCSGAAVWIRLLAEQPDETSRDVRLQMEQARKTSADVPLLLCPADAGAFIPTTYADRYLWDEALADIPPPALCSYSGRDFAANPFAKGDERSVIGACLHHPGGALIARADGAVEFMTLKDLGLASDAEKTVGPGSKSPLLRVLR